MESADVLWVAGGLILTVLLATALASWVYRESVARMDGGEPPADPRFTRDEPDQETDPDGGG